MSEVEMNLSVNGESKVPPGFRFHPTEEELLLYYLTKKVGSQIIDLDVIRDVDLNKLEPWDIQEKCKIGSTPQNDWYFFSHKDKKYPTGTRTNRATAAGFWKATGRDKVIHSSFKRIGMRKTLVFYKGRAPHGQKSDWIMHEYRLDEHNTHDDIVNNLPIGDSGAEEGWVVCRVFKKKNYHKSLESPIRSSSFIPKQTSHPTNDAVLDQILHYMGKSCKQENDTANNILNDFPSLNATTYGFNTKFSNLPRLQHASAMSSSFENSASGAFGQTRNDMIDQIETYYSEEGNACNINIIDENKNNNNNNSVHGLNDWVALDQLVASQLNGQDNNTHSYFSCYDDITDNVCFTPIDHNFQLSNLHPNKPSFQSDSQVYNNDLWSCFTQSPPSSSSSVPLADLSV